MNTWQSLGIIDCLQTQWAFSFLLKNCKELLNIHSGRVAKLNDGIRVTSTDLGAALPITKLKTKGNQRFTEFREIKNMQRRGYKGTSTLLFEAQFHLKGFRQVRELTIFSGDALEHIDCAIPSNCSISFVI